MSQARNDSLAAALGQLGKIVRRSRRYHAVYAVTAALAAVAAFVAPALILPIYVSQTVLLHRELVQVTTLLGRDAPVETSRQRSARLRDMLLARSNLEPILHELGLYPEVVRGRGVNEALDAFLRDVDCRVGDDSYTIKFSYRDPDVAFAATKLLGDSLVKEATRYRLDQAQSTRDFLAAQKRRTERELREKEQALAEFLAAHPEFAQDLALTAGVGAAGASIRAQQRKNAAIDPSIASLQRQRQELARRLQLPGAAALPIPDDADPQSREAVARARAELDRAAEALADARLRYTDAHPDVVAARRELESARAGYDQALANAASVRGAPPPAADDGQQRERLQSELRALDVSLLRARQRRAQEGVSDGQVVDLETQWTALNRDVIEVRDRYQQIERRYFQAAIMANVEASGEAAQMVIVDPAFRPERPAARGKKRVAAAAAGAVLVLGMALALALGRLDERLCDEDDVRALSIGPLWHALPRSRAERRRRS